MFNISNDGFEERSTLVFIMNAEEKRLTKGVCFYLARGVPDLEFDFLAGNFDDSGAELNADRVRTNGHD